MFHCILANIGNNNSERLLPFKMWVNLPLTVTPYYEIMFAIEVYEIFNMYISRCRSFPDFLNFETYKLSITMPFIVRITFHFMQKKR